MLTSSKVGKVRVALFFLDKRYTAVTDSVLRQLQFGTTEAALAPARSLLARGG